MRRARVRLNLIFFALLFAVLLFEATRAIITVGQITHPYQLRAVFTDANGVVKHDEVDYLGVPYGEVSSVSRDPADGGAIVHMAMAKDHLIPKGSVAHLDLKSTIGEQYINFQPPAGYRGSYGPYYPAGFKIPAQRNSAHPDDGYTTTPVQFSELLQSATSLLQSIPADQLQSLVTQLSVALQGTADSLRSLVQSGDRLSGTLVTRTQAINQLIANSTILVHVVTQHRASLDQSLLDLTQVAATLQSIQPTTNHLLDTASPLFRVF
ncbi:MAG: MlaD family protein [Actinomycetota bacterium]|nr:MlaD family protein [Actinomycetota bacterium]